MLAGAVDIPRLTSLGAKTGFDVVSFEDLGLGDAMRAGRPLSEAIVETLVAACRRFSVSAVKRRRTFRSAPPISCALLALTCAPMVPALISVAAERRLKSSRGIRRGIRAAEAAMAGVRDSLHRADNATVEQLRGAAQAAVIRHGAVPHDMTTSPQDPKARINTIKDLA